MDPIARRPGSEEERRATQGTRMAEGSLACPSCDAPVALSGGAVPATATLVCPFCAHRGRLREFLSLAVPARPARVEVHVRTPPRRG